MSTASLREELVGLLPDLGARIDAELDDHASLVASGLIDSVGLFQLLLWIEEKTGTTIDPGEVDWRREWDTVAGILDYIARRRQSGQAAS